MINYGKPNASIVNKPAEFQRKACNQQEKDMVAKEKTLVEKKREDLLATNLLPVPPPQALAQNVFCKATRSDLRTDSRLRLCAGAPFGCNELAVNCEFNSFKKCKNVICGKIVVPEDQTEREKKIEQFRKARKAERARHKRKVAK